LSVWFEFFPANTTSSRLKYDISPQPALAQRAAGAAQRLVSEAEM
jgi:hypothetical protein